MKKDVSNAIEKMFGKKVCNTNLNIEGFEHIASFDIYDGFAICEDYDGKELVMQYPKMEAIKESKEIEKAILDYIGCDLVAEQISPLHSLITFNRLYIDGIEKIVE